MAKKAAHNVDLTINSVAMEGYTDSIDLSIDQETPEVTSFGDAGPRRVVGNYDYGLDIAGKVDVATSTSDATLFGLVGSAGVALSEELTGTAGGANTPEYISTSIVLASYKISAKLGGALEYSASFKGNAALTRTAA